MTEDKHLHEVKKATLSFLGKLWEDNYRKNRDHILRTPGVARLFDRFKSIPAVVVGAGPSLDRNLRYLALAKGKSVIIACDTALKILAGNGIMPDIVINLDPQMKVMNFFDGVNSRGIVLAAPTIAYPALRESWEGDLFYYNKHAPDIPLLTEIAAKHAEVGTLTPGGTVLSVAFDLAFKSGADPIAFVGQDLSYTEDNAYAAGSHFGDYKSKEIIDMPGDQIVESEDIFGRKRKTQKQMAVTKQWFNWAFNEWNPDKKRGIYNCSEGGILTECGQMP
ncbi:MAG: 6-hydroxymethylpterin diphosphokinase MptE-like protein, partial [Nitrospinota bacterium]